MKTLNIIHDESNKIDIFYCIQVFYLLEIINALKKVEGFRKSHEKWEEDWSKYCNRFKSKLAQAIFDYTVCVCFGEARHGSNRASYYLEEVPQGKDRNECYKQCYKYSPISILNAMKEAFNPNINWVDGYGGYKWAQIAQAGLYYFKYNSSLFIDHCCDLCHNNGTYFNKATIFLISVSSGEFVRFLNLKKFLGNAEALRGYGYPRMSEEDFIGKCPKSSELNNLLNRAINIGILSSNCESDWGCEQWGYRNCGCSFTAHDFDDREQDLFDYVPINWGEIPLSPTLCASPVRTCYQCGTLCHTRDMANIHGRRYCGDCYTHCRRCGQSISCAAAEEYHGYDYCHDCYEHVQNKRAKNRRTA